MELFSTNVLYVRYVHLRAAKGTVCSGRLKGLIMCLLRRCVCVCVCVYGFYVCTHILCVCCMYKNACVCISMCDVVCSALACALWMGLYCCVWRCLDCVTSSLSLVTSPCMCVTQAAEALLSNEVRTYVRTYSTVQLTDTWKV